MTAAATTRKADRIFDALGDPTRRAIFRRVSRRVSTVSELALATQVTLTAIGQHLAVLEQCGLVRTHKAGRVRRCTVNPGGLAVLDDWISLHQSLWAHRLDTLGDILEEDASA